MPKKLDAFAFLDLPYLSAARRHGFFEKDVVIGNPTVASFTRLCQSLDKHRSWGLIERWVIHLIIDLIGPFAQVGIEIAERPAGLAAWVYLTRGCSWDFTRLGIPQQIVEEGSVSGAKDSLNDGPESRLSGRPNRLLAVMADEQMIKILTLEFFPSIDDQRLWQASEAFDADSHTHHTGPVGRRIKGEIDRQHPATERIHQKGRPGAPKVAPGSLCDQFNIQQGMVEMDDGKGAVAMDWGVVLQIRVGKLLGICRTGSPALRLDFGGCSFPQVPIKRA